MIPFHTIKTDVLVVGSGIAGLCAAAEAARSGRKVLLVCKSAIGKASNTYLAGGFFSLATDTFPEEKHFQETIESGRSLNNRDLVRLFVSQAPLRIKDLLVQGLKGSWAKSGVTCWLEGPAGGPEIVTTLKRACHDAGVHILEKVSVTDLVVRSGICHGVIGFKKEGGDLFGIQAQAVILATGGAGALYAIQDNAPGATGDGYALALEAGLELLDLEFVQFYPLVYAGSPKARMILPTSFADLGRLTNRLGEDLKEKYQLHERPLAIVARDRLSQALFREILLGNSIQGALFLDLRQVKDADFPLTPALLDFYRKKIGFDQVPIKIMPACHHTMGGLAIDRNGATAIQGLYAAGECVGGIHGANRMGGNALSEALVFGALAGREAARYAQSPVPSSGLDSLITEWIKRRINRFQDKKNAPQSYGPLRREVEQILWEQVGIIRESAGLEAAISRLDRLRETHRQFNLDNPKGFPYAWEEGNALLIGRAIAAAALKRTESRGAHFRRDFPRENPDWLGHLYVRMENGLPEVVRFEPINPDS